MMAEGSTAVTLELPEEGTIAAEPSRLSYEKEERKVAQYAYAGCQTMTIASLLCVDEGTIRKRYSDLLRKKRAERKAALHATQMRLALAGDRTMLIWLGKNSLGQSDKAELHQTHTVKMYGKEAPVEEA